jgi:hypothetical protein
MLHTFASLNVNTERRELRNMQGERRAAYLVPQGRILAINFCISD